MVRLSEDMQVCSLLNNNYFSQNKACVIHGISCFKKSYGQKPGTAHFRPQEVSKNELAKAVSANQSDCMSVP